MADRALGGAGSGDERGHRGRKSPVQRLLSPVGDVGTLLRDLRKIIGSLEVIAEHVISLDEEFKRMNQSVTEMRDEVKVMSAGVQPLDQRLQEVREGFERIEPMLENMNLAIHPLRRARRKLGSNGTVIPDEAAQDAVELEDDAAARSVDAS
jgi:hypothetical protein